MAKKDGIEIFELFRHGAPKNTGTDGTRIMVADPPAEKPTTPLRLVTKPASPTPAPGPSTGATAAAAYNAAPAGDTVISLKLNTALFGLMVGAACLFGSFALGVQWERRQHGADAPAPQNEPPPAIAHNGAPKQPAPKRDLLPPPPKEEAAKPPAPREPEPPAAPRKGWTLQLMAYPEADRNLADRLCERIAGAGGSEASVVKLNNTWAVLAGFVEKQSAPEADALLRKYRGIAERINKPLNLSWLAQTK
ncbi:MAG: hypothetical protein HYY18_18760 [Planctomycetes bacterium]|nr:hypothetical protein [Planctomycetota bacterium]